MSYDPWGPPPPSPPAAVAKTGSRALVIGLCAGLALLLVATIGVVHWLSPAPPAATAGVSPVTAASASASDSPTAAAPSRLATSKPTMAPKPTTPPKPKTAPREPDTSLKKNSIYDINLSGAGSCRLEVLRPKPPLKNSRLAPYLRKVVGCVADAFRQPLAKQGFHLRTPRIKTFTKSIKTPCGRLYSNTNPAFYCSDTIYWPVSSDDGREAYTFARLGYVGLTAHEFGHHLQATTGMFYSYGPKYSGASSKGRLALSRRLELQAQCFEGVFLSHDRKAIKLSSRDRSELRTWHSYTGDEDPPSSRKPDHGTSKAQLAWLFKGMDGADFGRCNTWSASTKSVK